MDKTTNTKFEYTLEGVYLINKIIVECDLFIKLIISQTNHIFILYFKILIRYLNKMISLHQIIQLK